MEPLKISLCVYHKNPNRPNSSYYARMRMGSKTVDIPLHTKDRGVAESWVRLRRSEIQRYNDYCLVGEEPPSDLLQKLPFLGQKQPQKRDLTIRECYDSWELEMRRRGLRERSILAYLKNVRLTVPLELPISAFTKDNVRLWLSKHDQLKSATRKHYSVSLREFAKYLVDNHGLDQRIVNGWPMIKVEHIERGYWTMPQMYQIISAVECKDKVAERFYKAYFWVMATVGSRQQETADLRWDDFRDGCLTFRAETTKSGETRRVPLDWRIADMLARLPREGVMLFGPVAKVTQAARYAVLRKAITKSKMPMGCLHTFRHSVSMLMYKSTTDIKATAQLLGHGEITALKHYQASRQADELRQVVDKVYESENLIPGPIDRMIEDGLI